MQFSLHFVHSPYFLENVPFLGGVRQDKDLKKKYTPMPVTGPVSTRSPPSGSEVEKLSEELSLDN